MSEPTTKKDKGTLRVPFQLDVEYNYTAGVLATRFFNELRDSGRLFGVRCPACRRVYLPPRPVCGMCFEPASEWIQVSDEGTIVGCTVVNVPFIDPMTGEQRPVPYGFAIIRLDGAATAIYHFLEEKDHTKMRVGQRVKAVFREKRIGSMLDIQHFRTLD